MEVKQYGAHILNAQDCVRVCAFTRESERARVCAHALVSLCDTQDMRGLMGLLVQHGQEKATTWRRSSEGARTRTRARTRAHTHTHLVQVE